jgi:hypothetical protein
MLKNLSHKGNASQYSIESHLTPVRMAIANDTNNKYTEDVGKEEHLHTVGGKVN